MLRGVAAIGQCMRVLLVKMSSLGDVVHALAGVTDAARAMPGLRFDWVVEEAYAAIPGWHPAVDQVVASPLRRLRKLPRVLAHPRELRQFRGQLRARSYDLVLDAQGLMKSAVVSRVARGAAAGRTFGTAREGLAALFYQRRHGVDLARTEVEQVRELFALALGYPRPDSPADFGIDRARLPDNPFGKQGPYAVFVHGAAWKTKLWAEENWAALGRQVSAAGRRVVLPWGNDAERERAERLAGAFGGEVPPKMEIGELAAVLGGGEFAVGLDTGLTHIAIALGVKTVTLYGPSVPVYESVAAGELIHLCSADSREVDTSRPNTVSLEAAATAVARWLRPMAAPQVRELRTSS